MKKSDVFPSKYLAAEDLGGKAVVVTVESAPLEKLKGRGGVEQNKTVLHFAKTKKCLPLNLTNWDSVADILGGDTDDWPGGRIELYPTTTEVNGETVACIRIRAPQQQQLPITKPGAPAKPTPAAKPTLGSEMDDEIPF